MDTIETPRLRLEPWDERHRDSWRAICRDRDVMRFIGAGESWEEPKADEVFDAAVAHWREHGFGWRSVLEQRNGEWLGFVGLNYVCAGVDGVSPGEVEIGWWIVRRAWGRGYASEGAVAARDEGFARLGLGALIARLRPENVASARVAERIGMARRRSATGRHGEALQIYGLERSDWARQVRRQDAPASA